MKLVARSTPWLLSAPAMLLFSSLLLLPLTLTAVLSFNVFVYNTGVKNIFTWAHYAAIFTDDYYFEIFWRTFWIAGLTTLIFR